MLGPFAFFFYHMPPNIVQTEGGRVRIGNETVFRADRH